MKDKNTANFSMKLNLDREQDRLVYEILSPLSRHNKAGFVKMAVLAYASRQSVREALEEWLAQWQQEGQAIAAPICSPSKSALKAEAPTTATEEKEVEIDLSDEIDFLSGLISED